MDDLRGTPMGVGSLEEIIDDQHAIVSSVSLSFFTKLIRIQGGGGVRKLVFLRVRKGARPGRPPGAGQGDHFNESAPPKLS